MIEPGALTTCYATHITVTYTCAACEKQKMQQHNFAAGYDPGIDIHSPLREGWTRKDGWWFCEDHAVSEALCVDGKLFHVQEKRKCSWCHGAGKIIPPSIAAMGQDTGERVPCPICSGTGYESKGEETA